MQINDDTQIAVFDCLSNAQMAEDASEDLLDLLVNHQDEFDAVMTAETKGIPFGMSVAQAFGKQLVVLRKSKKGYFKDVFIAHSDTYTTANGSTLYADAGLYDSLKGKKILIVDDVISTGSSLEAMKSIISQYDAELYAAAAIFAEAPASEREDIWFVEALPVFDLNGNPK